MGDLVSIFPRTANDGIRFTLKGQEILSLTRLEVECLWLETQTESELADSLHFHQQMVKALTAELNARRSEVK